MSPTPNLPPTEPDVRPHAFDGIREFNQRLPNWWLFTLYGAVLFWIGYWSYFEWFKIAPEGQQRVELALTQIEAQKLAATAALRIDDQSLWAMSRNPVLVDNGRQVFVTNCVACHLLSLRGKSENPAAIGPDLTDQVWIHGGRPGDIYRTVTQGVAEKGMPTWGPVLGAKRITEVVAYVLSHHHEGELTVDASTNVAAR
jgi:cytochrome c oxidase cbb3-type subunit III